MSTTDQLRALPASDLFGFEVVDRDGNRIRQNMSVYADGVVWNVQHALPSMIILNRTRDDGRKMTMLLGPRYWRLISVQGWYAGDWPNDQVELPPNGGSESNSGAVGG